LEPISGYLALGARLFGQKGKYSGAWNFGPPVGEVHTVIDVVNLLASHFDNLQFIIEESDASKHEAHFLQLNSDKARQLLSWNTKWDFKKTIEEVAYWYRAVLLHNENASKVTQDQILRYYEGAL
jgi:CDP-glucose 4,6-dehydratase